jgi:hypothetical protein
MAELRSTRLGTTDLTQDPAITLKNYIASAFSGSTDPVNTDVYFTTILDRWDKHFVVYVEEMLNPIQIEDNGSGRYKYDHKFKIQIIANRHVGKDIKWKMEKLITSKINANRTGMQSNGIDEALITEFIPIPSITIDAREMAVQDTTTERSYAVCSLRYYKYVF